MHNTMRVLFVAVATAAIAFAQDSPPQSKSRPSKSMGGDHQFMMKAAQGGMAEVQLGQLAQKNASNSSVKQFGERMVTDHSKANDQAKALAGEKNITLPTSLSAKDQALYRNLSGKTGSDFDKAYITAMLKDHKEDIAEFQQEANSGTDPDIKAWAAKTLPTLQEHLRMAEDCAKQLGISTTTGGDQ
jgi:putative membrane protein